jgi:hypothetical protein
LRTEAGSDMATLAWCDGALALLSDPNTALHQIHGVDSDQPLCRSEPLRIDTESVVLAMYQDHEGGR